MNRTFDFHLIFALFCIWLSGLFFGAVIIMQIIRSGVLPCP